MTTASLPVPAGVDLVWHGLNDPQNLRQFLASTIHWGECDVRSTPEGDLIARHDDFDTTPRGENEALLPLPEAVETCLAAGKALKLDLKEGGPVLEGTLALLEARDVADERLWFNANLEVLGESGFRRLARERPGAVLQTPVSGFWPLVVASPETAQGLLEILCTWGINRMSLNWKIGQCRAVFERLRGWGHAVNLYALDGLDDTVAAAALRPASITTDFNFPEFHYFGRGPGVGLRFHRYALAPIED